jgi:hypothetical protein
MTAARACPRWRKPVGLGAKRVTMVWAWVTAELL